MDKHALWKWLILVAFVAGSLAVVTPPLDKRDADGQIVRRGKIRFGLDLKGGTSFAVRIDADKVREDIRTSSKDLTPEEVEKQVSEVMRDAQARSLEVLRNRIDKLGISEPQIYPGKDDRIIIQLPGIDAATRADAIKTINSVAFLEFRMVDPKNGERTAKLFSDGLAPEGYSLVRLGNETLYKRVMAEKDMNDAYRRKRGKFQAPVGYEFMLEKVDREGQTLYAPYFVQIRREFSGENIANASVGYNAMNQALVRIEFDGKGTKKFARVTSDYAPGGARNPNPQDRRYMAIVLDGTLYSAPYLREAIFGGKAEISGSFTAREAQVLAHILSAGSLPAPVKIVEQRFVAPSLGAGSIRSGINAIAIGGVGVLLFMAVYYMAAGLIADLALVLNMLLLPLGMIVAAGFLSIFAKDASGGGPIQLPVLTLPGIAGILLTIGMAVDANVLIFERIREESRSGKRLWSAITAGYDRAFVTIMDANLTTLITGIILFVFGSGPIRGFAVTLCAGIVVSMFTALVVTKLFFALVASKSDAKQLKMLSLINASRIDFVGKRKIAAAFSIATIVASCGVAVFWGITNPGRVFGVDFTGGSSITFSLEQHVPIDELTAALNRAQVQGAYAQYQQEMDGSGEFLQVKTGVETVGETPASEVITQVLERDFPASKFVSVQEDDVGANVGKELQWRALWSIILALLGIVIYVSWRFELGFAIGAIVALAHDVLFTVGVYCLLGRQLSLPIVAALLTIVGYSVNDTIVVFDRIREDLRLNRTSTFKDICNLSINQTLSRTVLTSLTTLITVVMLLIFGGGPINDFALALCIGVIVGTYSSIFVATPVVLLWYRDRKPEFAAQTVK